MSSANGTEGRGPGWYEYLGRRIAMTAKAVRAYGDQQQAKAGASLTEAIITRILAESPGLTQRELADSMGVEGPTMARHMDRLEREGVVTRERDGRDRRLLRVRLTARGEALHRRLVQVSAETHDALAAVFTPAELAQFEEYLNRVGAHAAALLDDRRSASA